MPILCTSSAHHFKVLHTNGQALHICNGNLQDLVIMRRPGIIDDGAGHLHLPS